MSKFTLDNYEYKYYNEVVYGACWHLFNLAIENKGHDRDLPLLMTSSNIVKLCDELYQQKVKSHRIYSAVYYLKQVNIIADRVSSPIDCPAVKGHFYFNPKVTPPKFARRNKKSSTGSNNKGKSKPQNKAKLKPPESTDLISASVSDVIDKITSIAANQVAIKQDLVMMRDKLTTMIELL